MADDLKLKTTLAGTHPVTGAFDADPQTAADQLNTPNLDYLTAVDIAAGMKWAAGNGLIDRLNTESDSNPASGTRAIARAAMLLFTSPHARSIDVTDPAINGMFLGLVAAGIMTQTEKDDFYANVATKQRSLAEQENLGLVGRGRVIIARQ